MHRITKKISENIVSLSVNAIIVILILLGGLFAYNKLWGYHIRARFVNLAPLASNLSVYCKGKRIGQTNGITLNRDYKFSTLKILLFPQKLTLPANTTARIKKLDSGKNYVELVLPETPSKKYLANGGTIEGSTDMDMDALIAAIGNAADVDTMVDDFSKMLTNMKDASNEIGQFFLLFSSVLDENRESLKLTTKNAAKASDNLNQTTAKFNNSINEEKIKNTVDNIDKSSSSIKDTTDRIKESSDTIKEATQNAKEITENVNKATKNIDQTMSNVDATVCDAKAITSNVKDITGGIKELLCKRFAGLKIFFGKPMSGRYCDNCCKKR